MPLLFLPLTFAASPIAYPESLGRPKLHGRGYHTATVLTPTLPAPSPPRPTRLADTIVLRSGPVVGIRLLLLFSTFSPPAQNGQSLIVDFGNSDDIYILPLPIQDLDH